MNRGAQLIVASATALAATVAPTPARACSCLEVSVERSWHQYSDMFRGIVRAEQIAGSMHHYLVEVRQPYSGCTAPGDIVLVTTPRSSAACGVDLDLGETYVLSATTGPRAPEQYLINLCGYNLPVDAVPRADRAFLQSRPVYCDGSLTCVDDGPPARCFADPCEVAPTCDEAATCESNPCSAIPCTAEFYDEGWNPVCMQ
jgi:hypothetical protein